MGVPPVWWQNIDISCTDEWKVTDDTSAPAGGAVSKGVKTVDKSKLEEKL